MSEPVWVGIDLGTQSVRALVLDSEGVEIASAAEPLHSTRTGDRHEQDPDQWRDATMRVLQRVTAALPDGIVPAAIAVSGTSGTLVPLDSRTGRPRGPAVMYDDRRGADQLARVAEIGGQLWQRLGYRMQASWGLPKALQMLSAGDIHDDAVIAHQPDVITSMLSGHLLPSDLSSALKTGADLDAVQWPADIFAELDPGLRKMNGLAASGSVIGVVSTTGAADTGLPAGCLIVAGMTDGCAAQIAAGALEPGQWNSVLGTTLVIKGVSDRRHIDPSGAVYAHRAPFGHAWYPGGASSTGAGAISALLPGRDLDDLTARLDPAAPPPVAYPLIGRGERFPFVAPDAVALLPSGSDDELFSAILHGVAFTERLAYDLLAATGYDTTDAVLFTGGGSRNPVWTQLRADVLQQEVSLASHSEGAAGMAMLAAAAWEADRGTSTAMDPLAEVARRMAPAIATVAPRDDRRAGLTEAYRQFVDHLSMKGWIPDMLYSASMAGVDR